MLYKLFRCEAMLRPIKILPMLVSMLLAGCMEWEYGLEEDFSATESEHGLFICNEGNFQYGNATLSFYDPATRSVENEVFYRANAMRLGDVAQSMTRGLHRHATYTLSPTRRPTSHRFGITAYLS